MLDDRKAVGKMEQGGRGMVNQALQMMSRDAWNWYGRGGILVEVWRDEEETACRTDIMTSTCGSGRGSIRCE